MSQRPTPDEDRHSRKHGTSGKDHGGHQQQRPARGAKSATRSGRNESGSAERASGRPSASPAAGHAPRYDLVRLALAHPPLKRWLRRSPSGDDTIDFADPRAVRDLNHAILADSYGIVHWAVPANALCPGVPGRSDYVHGVASLLAADRAGRIPRGPDVRVFDVGMGATCIYPIIGRGEYGWCFIGSEIDDEAIASATRIIDANPALAGGVEIRRQPSAEHVLVDVLAANERFAAVMCNPPFHASLAEAHAGTRRKWTNLGRGALARTAAPATNFGGRDAELWCLGGEVGFIGRMIRESVHLPLTTGWFTALLSKASHLPAIERAWAKVNPAETRVLPLARGQKQSRIVAWTFLAESVRRGR